MGNINAKDPDYWNVPDDPGVRYTNWMSALPDSMLISDVSIPGTHDTLARDGIPHAWCQSLSLLVQLLIGFRFLDIRCRHFNNGLPIHHGAYYQNTDLRKTLEQIDSFLRSYPSEFVVMRVKEEYDSAGNTREFWQTVQANMQRFPHLFWLSTRTPTVGEVRGKIVVLVDFDTPQTLGIPYDWPYIEDHYSGVSHDDKWNYVKRHLDTAIAGSATSMFLTHNSFTHAGDMPREIARIANTKLHDYVRGCTPRARLGLVAIDYPGPGLARDIINTNFR